MPYTWVDGTAVYKGEPISRSIAGFSDSKIRMAYNFIGAPALALKDFQKYKQNMIVGASFQVTIPTGEYDSSKLVNIGTNRYAFKPEIGVSKMIKKWTLEFASGITFFTDNNAFFGTKNRSQEPLYSFQSHVNYSVFKGAWIAFDGIYYMGGRSSVDDVINNDLQQNWRFGGTVALPINKSYSLKIYASSGVSARTGNNYDLYGIVLQYRWGAGL